MNGIFNNDKNQQLSQSILGNKEVPMIIYAHHAMEDNLFRESICVITQA